MEWTPDGRFCQHSVTSGPAPLIASVSCMGAPTDNETWIIDAGDAVIQKKTREGIASLSSIEGLVYCLWVADYGMRNAGDLEAARDVYADFQTEAVRFSQELGLGTTHRVFSLPVPDLQREYFSRFEEICDEIKRCS
jgi:hypothetical protein